MKGFRKLLLVGVFLLAPTADAVEPGSNEAIVRYVFEESWQRENFDLLPEIWSEDTIFHFRGRVGSVGPDDLKEIILAWRALFSDFEYRLVKVIAVDDVVVIYGAFSGVHVKRYKGIDPQGGVSVSAEVMMIFRIDDKKIAEVWEVYDEHEMRRQMLGK